MVESCASPAHNPRARSVPFYNMHAFHRLGWLPDIPDVRDVYFRAIYMVPRELPPRVDLRAGCSPVEYQGDLGSCTAQALAGALEYLELAALRSRPLQPAFHDLSRLFIYYNERAAMGTVREDSGAMLRVGIKTMARLGACKEQLWPYDVARFASKPPARCYAEAAARTGLIRLPRSGERMLGGHAVMAVGYDDARGRLRFRNSWGEQWGQKGYGEMPYDYLTRRELSDDFWCIQSTASDLYALRKT